MPTCPFCNTTYEGTPDECPSCHKELDSKQEALKISNSNRNNDIGKNIKKLADVLFFIGLISSFICAVAFSQSYYRYETEFDFLKFIIIFFGGGLSSYISYMLICGFGALIDSSINTENNSAESLKLIEKLVIMQQDKENKENEQ